MTTNHKAARRVNEQYHCHHCGKQWDYNDHDPPECIVTHKDEGVLSYTPKQRYKANSPGIYYCDICEHYYGNADPCEHSNIVACPDDDEAVCGECNDCSTFCDVCGSWYYADNPCRQH